MKKMPLVGLTLFGCLILIFLHLIYPANPAVATEPTPTPPSLAPADPSSAVQCRLAQGEECELFDKLTRRPLGLVDPALNLQLHPVPKASDVPTYTLVSVAFPIPVEPDSVTASSFYLTQAGQPIAGRVDYIQGSQTAVFYPASPLLPSHSYAARVTRGVRYGTGASLEQDILWEFTTTTGAALFPDEVSTANIPSFGNMKIYFGDLHSHSLYSDGWGTPLEAYQTARARGLEFFALTEHGFMLTQDEWTSLQAIADSVTVNGQFIGIRGFEYTGYKGHLNVFNTDTFVHRNDPQYDTQAEFYNWLLSQPNVIAQFNHPSAVNPPDFNFNNFAYNPPLDHKIVLQELRSTTEFFRSLNNGWHLGSVGNSDAHVKDWGARRMGIVAPNLTRSEVFNALAARRTFFASPNYPGLAVVMQANGYWMGSAVPNTTQLNFNIHVHDPSPDGKTLRLKLYENGSLKAQANISSRTSYYWSPSVSAQLGNYYYVEVYYDGWSYPAYSSPIWVERGPIADAGSPLIVPTGSTVALDGSASYDPDLDALIYQWNQLSGPAVSLNNKAAVKPAFTAPNSPTDLAFQLTVADPGGLTVSDTVAVQVTDQPILRISKTGPKHAEPGELITYLLKVTNIGATPAMNVTVTDRLPSGANYVSGGNSINNGVVTWIVPTIPANGGVAEVSFTVTTNGAIANVEYGATCANCIAAQGSVPVLTNGQKIYFPVLKRNR